MTNETTQGRAVTLPNGQRRIDYIREQFYEKGVSRSDIKKAINEMLGKDESKHIPYQIVFAATKLDKAAFVQAEKDKKAKAEARAKAKKEKEVAAEKAKKDKATAKAKETK